MWPQTTIPASGRRPGYGSLGVEIAGMVHARQFLAAQEEHARRQSATRGDPALDR